MDICSNHEHVVCAYRDENLEILDTVGRIWKVWSVRFRKPYGTLGLFVF